ncbi:hypothetical protein RZN25_05750 [Bacillaceae bacterium S4-13-56]
MYQRYYVTDTLAGKMTENRGELPQYTIRDHHPAIMSREDWEAAQQIMNNRSENRKGSKKRPHDRQEFFNIFHCSECGAPVVTVSGTTKRQMMVFVFSGWTRGGGCYSLNFISCRLVK